ncbi:hypothetical protein GFS31_22670 [Leptolyngbya sp. BL0902]|nr:hypothetical protein GFS31_22670 [Leptolyngbya sp. BL0902]
MSLDEACEVITALEQAKARRIERYRNSQVGSQITAMAFEGTKGALQVTAKGLKLNPITALAGIIVDAAERGIDATGGLIVDGISTSSATINLPVVQELEEAIQQLNKLVSDAQASNL